MRDVGYYIHIVSYSKAVIDATHRRLVVVGCITAIGITSVNPSDAPPPERTLPSRLVLSSFSQADETHVLLRDRLRRVMQAISEFALRVDPKGRIVECYSDVSPLFGTRQDLVGHRLGELLPTDIAAAYEASVARALEQDKVDTIELRLLRDSEERFFLARQVKYSETELISVVRDISDFKQSEKRLRQGEYQYRMLVEHASDAIFIADAEGRFLEVNRRGCALLDKSEQELVNMSIEDLLASDKSAQAQQLLQHLRYHKTFRLEHVYTRPDGEDRCLEINIATMPDGRLQGIVRDFTERQKTFETLQKSEQWFRLLIERTPSLVFVHRDYKIIWANQRAIRTIGIPSEELLGMFILDLVHPDDRPFVSARIQRQYQTGEPSPVMEERIVRPDGTVLYTQVTGVTCEFHGEPAAVVIVQDITERKRNEMDRQQLERRIQHAQKLQSLGVLAGGIAHDFNNLLMGVLGNASLALMDLSNTSPVRESLQRIEIAARRAADLTRQLLAYSGKGRFATQPMDLSKAVEEVVELLKTVISKRASLRVECDQELPMVDADAMQLRQVIMNLITNASDALRDTDGAITVRTSSCQLDTDYLAGTFLGEHLRPGRYVVLEVSDTGCGMDNYTVDRIFDPFFSTKTTGHGLGLAAVLGIVRGHRGTIQVYSEPGRGTSFKVLFPSTTSVSSVRPAGEDVHSWTGHGTILIVDDDSVAQATARKILQHKGFTVIVADDGLQALELYCADSFGISLVILDMTMPRMSGPETLRALRGVNANLRVLLTSGYDEQETLHRFSGVPLAGFIQKPYTAQELVLKVAQALGIAKGESAS